MAEVYTALIQIHWEVHKTMPNGMLNGSSEKLGDKAVTLTGYSVDNVVEKVNTYIQQGLR